MKIMTIVERENKMKKIKAALCVMAAVASMSLVTGCKGNTPGDVIESESQAGAWKTDVKLTDVREAVQTAYGENYIPNMDFDAQMMKDVFGISEDMYEEFFGQGPMISVQVDTLVGVKAKADKADAVEQALTEYQKRQIEDAVQYPMNLAKVNASEVVRYGDYVFFVMLGEPSPEAQEKGEEAALESAKETNQIGLDAIEACFQS